MLQAQFQAIGQEIKQIKQELREFIIIMSTTDLEKQNLEAHVDLTINSGSNPDEDARLKIPINVYTNST